MLLSKVENKINLNNSSYRIVSSAAPKTASAGVGQQNDAINFLGNNDFGISKAYASVQIDSPKQKAARIWNEIENSNNIAILTHKIPDGDAVSSGLALLNTLRAEFPDKQIDFITPEGIPNYLKGTPGTELITTDKNTASIGKYDLAIAVDCDEEIMDGLNIYKSAQKRINIDHHSTNTNLIENKSDSILLIDGNAPSATEVIYNKLLKQLNITISPAVAECLLTGLLTDTGRFKKAQKPSQARQTGEELLKIINDKKGKYKFDYIYEKLEKNTSESDELKNLGDYLLNNNQVKTIESKKHKKINYVVIDQDTLNQFGVKDNNVEIKQKVNMLTDTLKTKSEMSVVFWELEKSDEIRVSIRSKNMIVNALAAEYGGGGHEHAAGIILHGDKDSVIGDFVSELKEHDFKES